MRTNCIYRSYQQLSIRRAKGGTISCRTKSVANGKVYQVFQRLNVCVKFLHSDTATEYFLFLFCTGATLPYPSSLALTFRTQCQILAARLPDFRCLHSPTLPPYSLTHGERDSITATPSLINGCRSKRHRSTMTVVHPFTHYTLRTWIIYGYIPVEGFRCVIVTFNDTRLVNHLSDRTVVL